jgi:hypothetical protein
MIIYTLGLRTGIYKNIYYERVNITGVEIQNPTIVY